MSILVRDEARMLFSIAASSHHSINIFLLYVMQENTKAYSLAYARFFNAVLCQFTMVMDVGSNTL